MKFEQPKAEPHEPVPQLAADRDGLVLAEARSGLPEVTPELIEQLGRQLAVVNGENPDEQPCPSRFPRWRGHRPRAKALLVIGPIELRALAKVLHVGGARETRAETDAIRLR